MTAIGIEEILRLAIAVLYIQGKQTEAKRLLEEMQQAFPGMSSQNPMFYVMLKPIDDILAQPRKTATEVVRPM